MNRRIEEYGLNAWPALQSFVHDGWLLRFANGYTKRSNSISPIYNENEQDTIGKIQYCEDVYSSVGLDTIFKITPFVTPGNIDNILNGLSYDVVDHSSVQILDLSVLEEPRTNDVRISVEITNEWLNIVTDMNELTKSNAEITKRLLSKSYLKKGFFILYHDTIPVACGVGVIEQNHVGLYDIVTDPKYRNRGYARELILHIGKWARINGVSHSYLLVLKSNAPAIKLYAGLGYEEIYSYWYRQKKRM